MVADLKALNSEKRKKESGFSVELLPWFGAEGNKKAEKMWKEIEQSNSQLCHWEINREAETPREQCR